MGRSRCSRCFSVLGLCLLSCRVQADAHDHSDHAHAEVEQRAGDGAGLVDFATLLGDEPPAVHVQLLYRNSNTSEPIFSWMIDASRSWLGALTSDNRPHRSGCAADDRAGHDEEDGHDHRRLLDAGLDHDHDHADLNHETAGPQWVLTAGSLEAVSNGTVGGERALKEALSYIAACLLDPVCVLEGDGAGLTDFATLLGNEPPAEHVELLYQSSDTSDTIFSWMIESSRSGCAADDHAGHDHRRLLEAGHDHDHEHGDLDHETTGPQWVLTAGSLEGIANGTVGGQQALHEALTYITACLLDPVCVLEGNPAVDSHADVEVDSGSSSENLALNFAAAFFVMTVIASYL